MTAANTRRRASVERLFLDTFDTQRNSAVATKDALNNPAPPTWVAHLTKAKCTQWEGNGRGSINVADLSANLHMWHIVAPLGTDIVEDENTDRVSAVYNVDGTQVNTVPLRITAIQKRATHIHITLEEVR